MRDSTLKFGRGSLLIIVVSLAFRSIGASSSGNHSVDESSKASESSLNCKQLEKADPELQRQVLTPFERKFAVISADPAQTSDRNISRVNAFLATKKISEGLQKQAEEFASNLMGDLKIIHATKPEAVLSILKQGVLFSQDELFRRCILPPRRIARVDVDGRVGERDVVFFAIGVADKPHQTNTGNEEQFGTVVFRMKLDEVLREGYFSPFSFGA